MNEHPPSSLPNGTLPSLEAFLLEMATRGWYRFCGALDPGEAEHLAGELEVSYAAGRELQTSKGLGKDADSAVHHLPAHANGEVYTDALMRVAPIPYLEAFMGTKIVLNSFGGVVNGKDESSYLHRFHRDVRTYTHDLKLMVNVITLLDDFTLDNGATYLLTGSHLQAHRPSDEVFAQTADRALGRRGDIIVFDSRIWHQAGTNRTHRPRRAFTLTFTAPFFKPQLDYVRAIGQARASCLSNEQLQLLGFRARVPASLDEWYQPSERPLLSGRPGLAFEGLRHAMSSSQDQELSFLNQVDKAYDDFEFDNRMRHYMLRSLRPFFRSGNALELGCFHGEFTTLLAQEFADLTVVDASEEFLSHTRARVSERVHFVQSLFETVSLEGSYDDIFLMHVLEHLQDPVAVLAHASQFLAPGGRMFLVVPNGNAPSRQIAVKMGLIPHNTALTEADIKHGHRRTYVLDTLEHDARAAGLSVLQRGGVFFKPLANFQFEKLMGGDVISDAYMEGCYQLGQEHPQMCASVYLVCERKHAA